MLQTITTSPICKLLRSLPLAACPAPNTVITVQVCLIQTFTMCCSYDTKLYSEKYSDPQRSLFMILTRRYKFLKSVGNGKWKLNVTNLISSVVHLHIITIHIQLHVLMAEHCGRFGVPVVTSHVISQHQNYVAGKKREKGERRFKVIIFENT